MKAVFIVSFIFGALITTNAEDLEWQQVIGYINSLNTTWKAGHNFGPHFSTSMFKRLLGLKDRNFKLQFREKHVLADTEIPEEFDSRKQWPYCPTISHIPDQGACGSCWAVAATSVLSDRLCIASGGNFTKLLSAEHLLACCDYCGWGCEGGFAMAAWNYLRFSGTVTGGDYKSKIGCQPYEIPTTDKSKDASDTPMCRKECTNPHYFTPFNQDIHRVRKSYSLPNDPVEIQKEILTHGPVFTGFTVYSDFMHYKTGVYQHTNGSEEYGRHAVRIIGWGTEEGVPYWLVANSWTEKFGENGYFKIRRGIDECDIEHTVSAALPAL